MRRIRIATRESPLAMWQAENVEHRLREQHPDIEIELIGMTTEGDQRLDTPLATVGGKGLFLKELEQALLENRADIAVHSMKDVTVSLPPGLRIAVLCERADPLDAFVSNRYQRLDDLGRGSIVGTSSLRRQSQLMHRYPQLTIKTLRGNVNTRLRKLDDGEYDAIILAAAGLKRLGFGDRIRHQIAAETSLPAVGQGVMGIECRSDDEQTAALIAPLNDPHAQLCVSAERAMNAELEGGCQVPIAGFAQIAGARLRLRGLVGSPDGTTLLHAEEEGGLDEGDVIGRAVAQKLLDQGAKAILDAVYQHG